MQQISDLLAVLGDDPAAILTMRIDEILEYSMTPDQMEKTAELIRSAFRGGGEGK